MSTGFPDDGMVRRRLGWAVLSRVVVCLAENAATTSQAVGEGRGRQGEIEGGVRGCVDGGKRTASISIRFGLARGAPCSLAPWCRWVEVR